jgi:thiol:disulfide interchange protein DsbD
VRSLTRVHAALAALVVLLVASSAWADACRVVGRAESADTDAFTAALSQGPLYAALAALVGGLAVSLTPCVYPMIVVTVSVFGAREAQSRRHGLTLSLAFVLGIVAMFVPLGVVAGMTGGMFGAVLQSRAVIVGISVIFLALAASMFGAFEFTLPSALANRLAQVGGIGYRGAFALGIVSGIIAAPCTGPVLTGILLWIAQEQNPVLGGGAMAAFALGLGTPFFLVGAFALQLPKSGRWLIHVKSVLGIGLAIVALYFLSTAFPQISGLAQPGRVFMGAMVALVVLGVLLGAVHRSFEEPGRVVKIRKAVGILLTTVPGVLLVLSALKPSSALSWQALSYEQAKSEAVGTERPLLVDFTADWCVACKKLERSTFSQPEVAAEAGRFVAIKVDATNADDPKVEAVKDQLNVVGLPTVLLFDSAGNEAVRCTDFVTAEAFLKALRLVN